MRINSIISYKCFDINDHKMKVTLREIKYAIAVSKHLNFRRASEECNVSISSLSSAIKNLEHKINFEIFERNNKKVIVTSLGREFLFEAKEIILKVKELENLADATSDSLSSNISLGIIPTIGPYLLPIVLPSLKNKYPNTNLKITEAQSHSLIQKIENGEIDMGIIALPYSLDRIITQVFWAEDFYWISHIENLQPKQSVKSDDLKKEDLMLLEDGHCLKDQVADLCNVNISSTLNMSASSLSTLVELVAGKMGSTLVPELSLEQLVTKNGVLQKAHLDEPSPHRELAFAYRESFKGQKDIQLLKELFYGELSDHFGRGASAIEA